MIRELINKYQAEVKKNLEQIALNNKIDKLYSYLENRNKFVDLDFSLYKDLFTKVKCTNDEILKLENNIKYVKAFSNSDEFTEYDDFITNIKKEFQKLDILKKDVTDKNDLENIFNKLQELKDNLENERIYIEDIDFIFSIFEYFNIEFKDIKEYMKEIIGHNKKVFNFYNEKALIKEDENIELNNEMENDFLESIIGNISFSNLEKNILIKYYLKNKEEFEQKYNALKDIRELDYILKNLENNKKIFVVLMTIATVDNINNVVKICKFRNLNIKKLLPNIFVSNGVKFKLDNLNVEDEFYSLFSGAYDNFINNLNYINEGLDLSKVEPTYYITDGNLTRNNHEILREYGFNLTIDSIECLTINDLEDKLNKIIESGLYLYFKENPRKLLEIKDKAFFYRLKYAMNNPNITYKRKHLAKNLYMYDGYGITEDNYNDFIEIYTVPLYEDEPYVSIHNISLENREIKLHQFISILDNLYLQDDKMSYNISEIIVSRIKVIKLFNQYLKSTNSIDDSNSLFLGFMYSVLNGLILSENETKVIVTKLMQKLKEYYPNELEDLREEIIMDKMFKSNLKGGL